MNKTRSFIVAVALALTLMPVGEAVAYYIGTTSGSGAITGAKAKAPSGAVVSILGFDSPTIFSPASIAPGDTVQFNIKINCVSSCPAHVTTVNLASWSSDKAGCDEASMPGSFTMPALPVNADVATTSGAYLASVTWANLPSINQTPCAGGTFTFNLVTP